MHNLTPVRFWILALYLVLGFCIAYVIFRDLRQLSFQSTNNLKAAELIAKFCFYFWVILIVQGFYSILPFPSARQANLPRLVWMLPFMFLSVLWVYICIQQLGLIEIKELNSQTQISSEFWWLDEKTLYYNQLMDELCKTIDPLPSECTTKWFKDSGIYNHWLLLAYSKVVAHLLTWVPALLMLLGAWLFSYKREGVYNQIIKDRDN